MNCTTVACSPEVQTTQAQTVRTSYRPRVEIWETENEFRVLAEVPGAKAEDVQIEHKDGVLTLSASVTPRVAKGGRPLLREYGVGGFYRTFQLGENIAVEQIKAALNDGVLSLELPKTPATQPRKIVVQTA